MISGRSDSIVKQSHEGDRVGGSGRGAALEKEAKTGFAEFWIKSAPR